MREVCFVSLLTLTNTECVVTRRPLEGKSELTNLGKPSQTENSICITSYLIFPTIKWHLIVIASHRPVQFIDPSADTAPIIGSEDPGKKGRNSLNRYIPEQSIHHFCFPKSSSFFVRYCQEYAPFGTTVLPLPSSSRPTSTDPMPRWCNKMP